MNSARIKVEGPYKVYDSQGRDTGEKLYSFQYSIPLCYNVTVNNFGTGLESPLSFGRLRLQELVDKVEQYIESIKE